MIELKPHSVRDTLPDLARKGVLLSRKAISAGEADTPLTKKNGLPSKPPVGFLLLDSSLRPISVNAEAIRILTYPGKPANMRCANALSVEMIRSSLINKDAPAESPFVTEFRSGKRCYFCRYYLIDSHGKGLSLASIAVLLERGVSGSVPLSSVSQRFNLTARERQALEHLVEGLCIKEIANRMSISPNTVKTFLRLIMIKMGVSSRLAVMRRIITTRPY